MDDPSLRVSDADREEVIVTLREHLLASRLTLEEFSERVEAALRARFGGELAQVQADLPRTFRETAGSHRKRARFTAALRATEGRRGQVCPSPVSGTFASRGRLGRCRVSAYD